MKVEVVGGELCQLFETGSFTSLALTNSARLAGHQSPRDLSASPSQDLGLQAGTTLPRFFRGMVGIELTSLRLHSKDFIDRDIFPNLGLSIFVMNEAYD